MDLETIIDAGEEPIGFWVDGHVDKREFYISVQKFMAENGWETEALTPEMVAQKYMQFDFDGFTGGDVIFINWSKVPKTGFDPCTMICWEPPTCWGDG